MTSHSRGYINNYILSNLGRSNERNRTDVLDTLERIKDAIVINGLKEFVSNIPESIELHAIINMDDGSYISKPSSNKTKFGNVPIRVTLPEKIDDDILEPMLEAYLEEKYGIYSAIVKMHSSQTYGSVTAILYDLYIPSIMAAIML